MSERYSVVAVARSPQGWFAEVARWATNARVPIELLKCLSAEEVDAVLGSGRRVSALLVDAGLVSVDRDLVGRARDAGTPTIVIDDGRSHRDWESLGAAEVLPAQLDPAQLMEALTRHSRPVTRPDRRIARANFDDPDEQPSPLVAVTGGGGTGSSTISVAVAQLLGDLTPTRIDGSPDVVLVDAAPRGDHAMFHDIGDVIPGLPELVDALRLDELDPEELEPFLFDVTPRPYRLLLGPRRPREWVTLRPRNVAATLDVLRRHLGVVVVDHDRELDGEAETGSIDVEELHGVARTVVAHADLVLAVGTSDMKGVHGLVQLLDELDEAGVPAERVLPVVNRAPRGPSGRATITATLARLTGDQPGPPPVFVPDVRKLEDHHRAVRRLPPALLRPLQRRVVRALDSLGPRVDASGPVRLRPGELGTMQPHDGIEVA